MSSLAHSAITISYDHQFLSQMTVPNSDDHQSYFRWQSLYQKTEQYAPRHGRDPEIKDKQRSQCGRQIAIAPHLQHQSRQWLDLKWGIKLFERKACAPLHMAAWYRLGWAEAKLWSAGGWMTWNTHISALPSPIYIFNCDNIIYYNII